ncbi:hypothetical protein [Nocardia rhamnosiphila]
MTTTHAGHVAAVLPASLTPARVERLITLVAAGAGARRVTTSPYTGAPLADLRWPMPRPTASTPASGAATAPRPARSRDGCTVKVNEAFAAAWCSTDAPMGGMGDSGLGRRHGADGLLEYTEARTIAHQRLHDFTPPRGVEQKQWTRSLTPALETLRALRVR